MAVGALESSGVLTQLAAGPARPLPQLLLQRMLSLLLPSPLSVPAPSSLAPLLHGLAWALRSWGAVRGLRREQTEVGQGTGR